MVFPPSLILCILFIGPEKENHKTAGKIMHIDSGAAPLSQQKSRRKTNFSKKNKIGLDSPSLLW
jgi:hypothetical protein